MIFVLDVGNTNTVLGVFEDQKLTYQWRIATDRHKTEDEYAMLVKSLFIHNGLQFKDINGIIISSVVPPIMFALERMCKKYFNVEPMVVGQGQAIVDTGLKMKYPNPNEIGADRIVNAVSGIKEYGSPLIIIDFGQATTYCYINEKEEYVGGAIAPGVNISTEALYAKAAKLPRIEIIKPENVVGNSTVEAMQAGIFYGYVGQVDEVVTRITAQATEKPTVIATGGLASLIAHESKTIDHVESVFNAKGFTDYLSTQSGKNVKELDTT